MLSKKLSKLAKRSDMKSNPSPTSIESNHIKSNSVKRPKKQLSPLEYLQLNNPHMFAKNMFSQGKVLSIISNNLERRIMDRKKNSYHQVISKLIKNNIIDSKTNKNIIDKMLQVDKKYYCTDKEINDCYNDYKTPISIGTPTTHMLAYACVLLKHKLKPGSHVLDIGTENGMLSVIFANMVNVRGDVSKKRGKVVVITMNTDTLEECKLNIDKDTINRDLLHDTNKSHFMLVTGDGKEGYPSKSKERLYDVIHVGGLTAASHAPAYLKYQLKEGGLLFLPIKYEDEHAGEKETIRIYQRVNGNIKFTNTELDVTYNQLE
jgi:protein-L-isoaspartate O-methyltransferase|tara:strand:- start:1960 stop:2916 length:957 start_codon:yes stop_codon:yes gene_type:complete